jgi:hypothetical protein
MTGPGGRYTFGGLDAGGYSVEVEFHGQAPPWLMTHPALSYEPPFARPVALAGTSATNQDFGLHAPFGLPQFMGLAWVDAAPADLPEVRALIGGVDCTGPAGIMPPDMDAATYGLTVLSDALKPGCGEPGDTISFTIDVHNANETAVWQPIPAGEAPLQDGRGMLTLTAGAPFAYLYPRLQQVVGGELRDAVNRVVIALIGDQVCGIGLTRVWGGHLLAVPSSEQAPGCGEPDAAVRFAVDGFAVPDTIVWSPGAHEGFTFTLQPSPDAATAGPAFAYFTFELAVRPPDYVGQPEQFIEALVDGVSCGSAGALGPATLAVAVAPDELIPGCGVEGTAVTFTLNGVALATAPWQPGFQAGPAASAQDGSAPTPTPGAADGNLITPPDTGDGGLKR